jgi:hypothetical protein
MFGAQAMTDIVERLREENDIMRRHLNLHPDKPLGNELRAEIERLTDENRKMNTTIANDALEIFELRAEVEKQRAALNELWNELSYMDGEKPHRLCGICKAALVPKP